MGYVYAFYHTSIKHEILHKDVFGYSISYLSKRQAQINYYNMAVKSNIAAIECFEGIYDLAMRACMKP